MNNILKDHKNPVAYAVLSLVNKVILRSQFREITVSGRENIPRQGAFLVVSNHTSRFDGLLIYDLISRPSNFMVTPNELKGLQGAVLKSIGSFPANAKLGLIEFVKSLWKKNEGVVIFPEGGINKDGIVHRFKSGAAKLALNATADGMVLPVIPASIIYDDLKMAAKVLFGSPINLTEYQDAFAENQNATITSLTKRLQREVCYGRWSLGGKEDSRTLFADNLSRPWLAAK